MLEAGHFGSRRLLVIDDNVEIHEDFAKILGPHRPSDELDAAEHALFGSQPHPRPQAFELDFCDRGEDSLALVRRSLADRTPYALAFVDIRMPNGWDGVRTVAEIWSVDPHIQIVLCTAYSDYSWDDITAKLGVASGFLILKKPFDVIEVRQMAQSLTQKWTLLQDKERHLEQLEQEVRRRTTELADANAKLQIEMTTRVRVEREHRHTQKLEALGRLAAGVGHEINNPLAYIVGNLDFCRDEVGTLSAQFPDASFDAMREAIEDAAGGAERIRRIVRDIRQFSRASEDPLGPVDVHASVRAAQRLVANVIRHRGTMTTAFGEIPAVIGEPSQLEQVLVNVLVNATYALRLESVAANEIQVATRVVSSGDVIIEIRDNGVGIAEDNLERVFDPFFTTREVGEGSGLGLSISRSIIERFGGKVDIESKVGQGTVVRLRLRPAATTAIAPPTREPVTPAPPTGPPGRLLLIDDEPSVLKVVQRMLAAFDVYATTSGAEAVERYQAEAGRFDLVLCDLMMPRFSGMDVYAELAKLGPDHARRIVFLSGGAFTPQCSEFLGSVTNPRIEKPFKSAQLRELVEAQITALRG